MLVAKPVIGEPLLDLDAWQFHKTVVFRRGMKVSKERAKLVMIEEDEALKRQTERFFSRIRGDRTLYYGDGGRSNVFYPVYFAKKLPVKERTRKALVEGLRALGSKTKDFHRNAKHVQDIIDPDLCAFLIDDWKGKRIAELKKVDCTSYNAREAANERRLLTFDQMPDFECLRSSYRWIPSLFVVSKRGDTHCVNIKKPINGLPVTTENKSTYECLAKVFAKMVPMFQEHGGLDFKEKGETEIQVVVKAQQYVLPPKSTYSGKWHTEGMAENIGIVGVYYIDLDPEIEGGQLKFRPQEPPGRSFASDLKTDETVSPTQGSAVVFSNAIPHRFRKISNNSDHVARRLFINFFILDPLKEFKFDYVYASKLEVVKSLKLACPALPKDMLRKIVSYLPYLWPSLAGAKRFRSRVKEEMAKRKTGWGYIDWGNCGTLKFIPNLEASRDDPRNFGHTDSDASDVLEDGN